MWHVGRYGGRNHVCNIWWLSVNGCGCGERCNFAFSHWLLWLSDVEIFVISAWFCEHVWRAPWLKILVTSAVRKQECLSKLSKRHLITLCTRQSMLRHAHLWGVLFAGRLQQFWTDATIDSDRSKGVQWHNHWQHGRSCTHKQMHN